MIDVKKESLNGFFWSAIEKFSNQGIRFLVGLVLARILSPSDFGAIAIMTVFISISDSFIDSGFGKALIRKNDRSEVDFSTVFYFNIIVATTLYILLFVLAPWISVFFKNPILCPVLRVFSLSLILGSLMSVLNAKLFINLDFRAIAIRSFISSVISGVVGITLAYMGLGIWALVYQSLTISFINLLFVWIYSKWIPLLVFSWKSFKELGSYGSKLLLASLLSSLYENFTPLAIGKFYTPKELGYYNRGSELATYPSYTLLSILQSVIFPLFSKMQDNDTRLIQLYRKYIKISSIPLVFFAILLASISKPLVILLLTDKWFDSIIYLQLLCFSVVFNHINTINLNLLQVKGRSDLFLKLEIIKKSISLIFLFVSLPFGITWICISRILYNHIAIIINTYYTGKLYNMGYISQVKDFIGYFGVALVSCIPAFIMSESHLPALIQVLGGFVLSSSIYILILRKDSYMREILVSVKEVLVNKIIIFSHK